MPRGVYERKRMEQCPKCTKTFNVRGITTHIAHCKGVANRVAFDQSMSAGNMINVEKSADYKLAQKEHEYSQLIKDTEGLRRVIATQREVIDTLCRAMIETNAVEGRWRA